MLFGPEHVARYIATDGKEGHDWQGTSVLLLTTTGRRSGRSRTTPLIYGRSGERYLVVASKGGAAEHPAWYENLVEQPEVHLQVWGEALAALARTATPEEKRELWPIMLERWPAYDSYQQKTMRDIPLVILERR